MQQIHRTPSALAALASLEGGESAYASMRRTPLLTRAGLMLALILLWLGLHALRLAGEPL
jgi:hypothetical protein